MNAATEARLLEVEGKLDRIIALQAKQTEAMRNMHREVLERLSYLSAGLHRLEATALVSKTLSRRDHTAVTAA